MNVQELLRELTTLRVRLEAGDGVINVEAPRGAVTLKLWQALAQHKWQVLTILRSEPKQARWNPLVPSGWTSQAWQGRLRYMAGVCMHPDRAEELRDWAAAVADEHGFGGRK